MTITRLNLRWRNRPAFSRDYPCSACGSLVYRRTDAYGTSVRDVADLCEHACDPAGRTAVELGHLRAAYEAQSRALADVLDRLAGPVEDEPHACRPARSDGKAPESEICGPTTERQTDGPAEREKATGAPRFRVVDVS